MPSCSSFTASVISTSMSCLSITASVASRFEERKHEDSGPVSMSFSLVAFKFLHRAFLLLPCLGILLWNLLLKNYSK